MKGMPISVTSPSLSPHLEHHELLLLVLEAVWVGVDSEGGGLSLSFVFLPPVPFPGSCGIVGRRVCRKEWADS